MDALMLLALSDPVGLALRDIAAGETIVLPNGVRIEIREAVPFGFKVAVRPIACGERVHKYRVPIGVATAAIQPGEVVHVHNLRSDYIATQQR